MKEYPDTYRDASREELLAFIDRLLQDCRAKDETIKALQERIKDLERRTRMNSTNSSKPPSSDGYAKPAPKSQRVKSGRSPGGQQGHDGHSMEVPREADEIVPCFPDRCSGCPDLAKCISDRVLEAGESRFVVDAVMDIWVREYRSMSAKSCPKRKERGQEGMIRGQFPEDVRARIQYGDSFAAVAGILNTYGAISLSRVSDIIRSMFGVSLSTATVESMVRKCAKSVEDALEGIRKDIVERDVCHFDETGVRCDGKLMWVHNSSTADLTYQTISERRGIEGILDNGVLGKFGGIAVHDCWQSYWGGFEVEHSVCCAHILRELAAIEEMDPDHKWPGEFRELLLQMKSEKERALAAGKRYLDACTLKGFGDRYDEILRLADSERPPPPVQSERGRGKIKLGKERALIERLRNLRGPVTLFVRDFRAPFDNNQAERDIRNLKTKTKVSGCFRTVGGARRHIGVMSYFSTVRKQGGNAFGSLKEALSKLHTSV